MIFVFIDADAESNKQVLEFFGLKPEGAPFKIIYEMEKNAKFVDSEKEVSDASVEKFVMEFFDGNLKRDLKSEDIPENWDKEPVKVLVSKNFKEVALDKTKDVFVEFYAPWCGK